jgi:hypothetical protein
MKNALIGTVLRGTRAGVPQGLRLRSRGPLPNQSIADLGDGRLPLFFPQRLVHQFIITSTVISFPLYACQASLIAINAKRANWYCLTAS